MGWLARDAMLERAGTPTTFARQAALTHALYAADVRRPVEVWASEEKSLVTWLTKRLGFPVHAPNLNDVGFALVGGRLVAGNEKPTALFMYENADHQRLSLQVRKQSRVARERRRAAAARPPSATTSPTVSACSTGSTTIAATRFRATSTAASCSRSRRSSTASSRRWRPQLRSSDQRSDAAPRVPSRRARDPIAPWCGRVDAGQVPMRRPGAS